jgi:ABC-type phosphate/phosphonate transport system substrate-binding protein
MRKAIFLTATLILALAFVSVARAQTSSKFEGKTITLGLVAEANQKEVEQHFQEFVRYLAEKLSPGTKLEGRVVAVSTQPRLATLLNERKADFYLESPHPTYLINSVYGAGKLLLRRWKGGMADYHTLIFTKRDGQTKRLEDLPGKMFAFEDPESTSGHFLPKLFLTKKGFKLSPKPQIQAKVARDEIGYIFALTQDKLMDLVFSGQAAAGAFSNDDYAALDDKKKSELSVLAETASLPRHLVSVRKTLPAGSVARLKEVLLSMHEDPEGRRILKDIDGTTKFDALPGGELAISQRLLDTFYSPGKK